MSVIRKIRVKTGDGANSYQEKDLGAMASNVRIATDSNLNLEATSSQLAFEDIYGVRFPKIASQITEVRSVAESALSSVMSFQRVYIKGQSSITLSTTSAPVLFILYPAVDLDSGGTLQLAPIVIEGMTDSGFKSFAFQEAYCPSTKEKTEIHGKVTVTRTTTSGAYSYTPAVSDLVFVNTSFTNGTVGVETAGNFSILYMDALITG